MLILFLLPYYLNFKFKFRVIYLFILIILVNLKYPLFHLNYFINFFIEIPHESPLIKEFYLLIQLIISQNVPLIKLLKQNNE